MITICVGVRNRTDNLLKHLIASMNRCKKKDQLSLSLFDCHSNDVPNLMETVKEHWDGHFVYVNSKDKFTRSSSINGAVNHAKSERIFLCDADMTLPVDFVDQHNLYVTVHQVWFPICFSLNKGAPHKINKSNGFWRHQGHGMVGIMRSKYFLLRGLSEKFKKWGGEDNDFFTRCRKKYKIVRENCKGLFHNWHPMDDAFKNKYYQT